MIGPGAEALPVHLAAGSLTGALEVSVFEAGMAGLFKAFAHSPAGPVQLHPKGGFAEAEVFSDGGSFFSDEICPPDEVCIAGTERRKHLVETGTDHEVQFLFAEEKLRIGSIAGQQIAGTFPVTEMVRDCRAQNLREPAAQAVFILQVGKARQGFHVEVLQHVPGIRVIADLPFQEAVKVLVRLGQSGFNGPPALP